LTKFANGIRHHVAGPKRQESTHLHHSVFKEQHERPEAQIKISKQGAYSLSPLQSRVFSRSAGTSVTTDFVSQPQTVIDGGATINRFLVSV